MLRKLTLSVDETLYDTLMPMVEKQTIGNLLAEFVQSRLSGQESIEPFANEREAIDFANGYATRILHETR